MKLEFNCPECGEEMITFFSKMGDTAKCKKCNKVITVPEDAIEVKKEYPITTLEFRCHYCYKDIVIENSKIGEKIECPFCHKTIVIPENALDIVEKYNKEKYISKDYPILKGIAATFIGITWIIGIAAIGISIYELKLISDSDVSEGILIIIYAVVGGFITIILFLAFAEMIKLFIDIASNTKNQTLLIEKLLKK